ncbi:MAG: DRTGG domain-containing protein [Halanaerobiales bacterium]
MKVKELVDELNLEVIAAADMEKEIDGAYVGDLLSNVMARAKEGNLWITIQGHQNVVAVALLASVSALIVVEDFEIEEEAVQRAEEKGINILRTSMTAYQLISKLASLGIE